VLPPGDVTPTAEQSCDLLLGRYGIITREVAASEGLAWTDLLAVLARREMLGRLRRGYFVRGLGGLQYALPQAVEALRQAGESPAPAGGFHGLASVDPALAWGRLLEWPEGMYRPRRPDVIVMSDGAPALVAEGRPLRIAADSQLAGEGLRTALAELVRVAATLAAPGGRLEVSEYQGRPVLGGPAEAILEELGFSRGPNTMLRWHA